MNIKSISEFIQENKPSENLNKYLHSFIDDKKVIQSYMLEFQNPYFLAGAYGDKYGLVLIQDHRLGDKKLLPEIALYKQWVEYAMSSKYNLPYYISEELNMDSREYISGYYDQETGEPVKDENFIPNKHYSMFEENIDSKSESLNHPFLEKHICAPGRMTILELLSAFEIMIKKDGVETTLKHISDMKDKIESTMNRFERRSCISIEKPFYLSVIGTDDASWGASFSSLEDLNLVFNEIKNNPNSDTVHRYLDFTN